MRKIEKIIEHLANHGISIADFERKSLLGNGYIKKTLDRGADLSQKILDRIEKFQPVLFYEIFPELKSNRPPESNHFLEKRQEQKMTISTLMVPLVPIKVQAGYITSHELTDFIERLDKFPMAPGINPRGAEWRWFEVAGESMEPTLYEGDYILCSMVQQDDWVNLENYYLYVIVTTGNLWVKRIVKKGRGEYIMHSDNKKVKQRELVLPEVREIWKVRRHLNARMPSPEKVIVE